MISHSISIVVRTLNEEKWIGRCIAAIGKQDISLPYEVIVVDSGSSDKTVAKASSLGAKVVTVAEFFPGLSINTGIRNSCGTIIVIISAHCVPADSLWLSRLIQPLIEGRQGVVATYGRQLPTPSSSAGDARDLLISFGSEDRLQLKDTFFHNANSALLRSKWSEVPFDEAATNIEDRIWAENIIAQGYAIQYCASASVYHWHGIHQYGNEGRLKGTIETLRTKTRVFHDLQTYYPSPKKWVAFVMCQVPLTPFITDKLKKLTSVLASAVQQWELVIYAPEPHSHFDQVSLVKTSIISRPATDLPSQPLIGSIRSCLELYEDKTGDIIEAFAVFNIDYLYRSVDDINDMVNHFTQFDCDILVSEYYDHNSETLSPCLQKDLTANSIFLNMHRSISAHSGTLIPGYCLLLLAASIRDSSDTRSVRMARFPVTGQSKLLKASTSEQLHALISTIIGDFQ